MRRAILLAHDHRDAGAWLTTYPGWQDLLVLTPWTRLAPLLKGVEPTTVFVTPYAPHHPGFDRLYSIVSMHARSVERKAEAG